MEAPIKTRYDKAGPQVAEALSPEGLARARDDLLRAGNQDQSTG